MKSFISFKYLSKVVQISIISNLHQLTSHKMAIIHTWSKWNPNSMSL